MNKPATYCIDASSIIKGRVETYPPDSFPSLWKKIEDLIAAGRLCAPDEIRKEVEKKTNEAAQWAKMQKRMFIPPSREQTDEVSRILVRFERLVNVAKGKSGGDPFLIALARLQGHIIVTEERRQNDLNNPRIPDVAEALGIECISLRKMIQLEQWAF